MKQITYSKTYKPLTFLLTIFMLAFLVTGCGHKKDAEIEAFKTQLDDFTTAVMELDTNINSIDPASDDAAAQLLSYYDSLAAEFETLAAIPVPEKYGDIARLSSKANDYMAEAVSYYHIAFESDTLSGQELMDMVNLASSYYEKSFEFVNYIGQVLMGANISFQSDHEDSGEGSN